MDILYEIQKSKKYPDVYSPLLARICDEESAKYKKNREILKAVKNRLHVIYGAFFDKNSVKKAADMINNFTREANMPHIARLLGELVYMNASVNERFGFIREFYKFIFDSVPVEDIHSVLDIGCGFNPFFLTFILEAAPKLKLDNYYSLDIDVRLAGAINEYLSFLRFPKNAGCMDIVAKTPDQTADMAFLFKIIPTIENCKKGRAFEILSEIGVKYAAVSFPTKTLCGKNVGMADNYAELFEKNIDHDKFKITGKHIFENELVYVLEKLKI